MRLTQLLLIALIALVCYKIYIDPARVDAPATPPVVAVSAPSPISAPVVARPSREPDVNATVYALRRIPVALSDGVVAIPVGAPLTILGVTANGMLHVKCGPLEANVDPAGVTNDAMLAQATPAPVPVAAPSKTPWVPTPQMLPVNSAYDYHSSRDPSGWTKYR